MCIIHQIYFSVMKQMIRWCRYLLKFHKINKYFIVFIIPYSSPFYHQWVTALILSVIVCLGVPILVIVAKTNKYTVFFRTAKSTLNLILYEIIKTISSYSFLFIVLFNFRRNFSTSLWYYSTFRNMVDQWHFR